MESQVSQIFWKSWDHLRTSTFCLKELSTKFLEKSWVHAASDIFAGHQVPLNIFAGQLFFIRCLSIFLRANFFSEMHPIFFINNNLAGYRQERLGQNGARRPQQKTGCPVRQVDQGTPPQCLQRRQSLHHEEEE